MNFFLPSCIFRVVFFCVVFLCFIFRFLFFVLYIFCVVFSVLYFLGYNFPCCIKIISLYATASYTICLSVVWPDSKQKISLGAGQPGLIYHLVICPCIFQNYISVSKLNFLLILLLL